MPIGEPVTMDIFSERGILDEVRDARRYLPYASGREGRATILEQEPRLVGMSSLPLDALEVAVNDAAAPSDDVAKWLWLATQTPRPPKSEGGWFMRKHSVFGRTRVHGFDTSDPLPQLRPNSEPFAGRTTHDHEGWFSGATWMWPMHPSARLKHENGPSHVDMLTGAVHTPREGLHRHEERPKYLLSPGHTGKRLDCNPLTLERGWDCGVPVVFCLEGVLKNDAIVSAGWPCFNVPSVSVWDAEIWGMIDTGLLDLGGDRRMDGGEAAMPVSELALFASRCLLNVPAIIVVCDSDWHTNTEVSRFAMAATTKLAALTGVPTVAAAPPEGEKLGFNHPLYGHAMRAKLGIDDWLGESKAHGPAQLFEDIMIRDPRPAALEGFAATLRAENGGKYRGDNYVTPRVEWLRRIQRNATPDGLAAVPFLELTDEGASGRQRRRVAGRRPLTEAARLKFANRTHAEMQERGVYTEIVPSFPRRNDDGKYYQEPAIVRLHEPFTPQQSTQRLGDWLDAHPPPSQRLTPPALRRGLVGFWWRDIRRPLRPRCRPWIPPTRSGRGRPSCPSDPSRWCRGGR